MDGSRVFGIFFKEGSSSTFNFMTFDFIIFIYVVLGLVGCAQDWVEFTLVLLYPGVSVRNEGLVKFRGRNFFKEGRM